VLAAVTLLRFISARGMIAESSRNVNTFFLFSYIILA